ncbi:MAG TPA: methyltransferase domain-containing protein [Polyangiaceae bacterium]|nr:methyltransferase domain-containing protein [Polyangiaceae bacterium]
MSDYARPKGAGLRRPTPAASRLIEHQSAPPIASTLWTQALGSVPSELFLGQGSMGDARKLEVFECMLQALALTGTERVLEVGTGTGYRSALLAHMAKEVYTLETSPNAAELARERHARLGLNNVYVVDADGSKGFAIGAPYQAILVSGALPYVPTELIDQLDGGGRLVIPVGDDGGQLVERVRKLPQALETDTLTWCDLSSLICEAPPRASRRPWMRGASNRAAPSSGR